MTCFNSCYPIRKNILKPFFNTMPEVYISSISSYFDGKLEVPQIRANFGENVIAAARKTSQCIKLGN